MRDESEKEGDLDKNVERKNYRKVFEREERKKENILKHYSSHRSCRVYVRNVMGEILEGSNEFYRPVSRIIIIFFFF